MHSRLIKKFHHCVKIGVNLSTFEDGTSGFDYLLSRDNLVERNVDIAFGKKVIDIPVVGFLLIDRQKKYGFKQRHHYIRNVITKYIGRGNLAPIWLDTTIVNNYMDVENANQFESIIKRTDFVVTNRLHGVILSLKNGVPVIAIDPIEGGGKVTAQVMALGWPILIPAEKFNVETLDKNINLCLENDFQRKLNL